MSDKHERFTERYANNDIPWDSGITPPEIVMIANELSPGKALDLGCGTGTVMQYLLAQGWQVDGIDYVQQAVDMAQEKLKGFPPERYAVYCHDVTRLAALDGLRSPYDLVIDIGCGHNLPREQHAAYAQGIMDMMPSGGVLMLYARRLNPDSGLGFEPDDLRELFAPRADVVWQQLSEDAAMGFPAGWYRLEKH